MTLRTLLRFQNPDSTQDLNDRFRGLLNKGVFSGGDVEAIASTLTVLLTPFATIGFDGMFVREDDDTNILAVVADERNYIVVRQRYVANGDPIVSVESLTEAQYLGDADPDALIVFAVVDVPVAATEVLASYIEFFLRDEVDPVGRLAFRGLVDVASSLPDWATTSTSNRVGDFYIVTDGNGGFPELWAWNENEWVNITQAQTMISLLDIHRDNLDINLKHVTDDQADALLGTVANPSITNRYVTDLDPRVPFQRENDALQSDPTSFSEFEPGEVIVSNPSLDSDGAVNVFVNSSKIFAAPAEKDFAGGVGSIELLSSPDGPFYVGFGGIGTAQQFFNIWGRSATPQDDDQELLNSEFQPVRITGIFTDPAFGFELNPNQADSNGFYSLGELYIQTDNAADLDFSIGYAKRTLMFDLEPDAFILRGPLFGQVDARVRQILESSVNAQFDDSAWTVGIDPGDVVAFDTPSGKFILADPGTSSPIGVRGNTNNLVAEGLYEFTSSTVFVTGDQVYADSAGALTVTPNEWFIGTFFDDTRLLVNMNAFGISASEFVPGVMFPGGLFDGSLLPGEVAAFDGSLFVQWDDTEPTTPAPDGIRGNNNNIIQVGLYQNPGTPYIAGTRYFASLTSNGQLTTTPNDFFSAHGITSSQLLVNIIGTSNWTAAKTTFEIDHDSATGIHSGGSSRTFVGTGTPGIVQSNSLASSTGMTYFSTDFGQVFHCTNGGSNIWEEVSRFSSPLEITDDLTVTGDLILPTGIIEVSDGAGTMDVYAHALRHSASGDDPIPGLVNQVLVDSSSSPITLTGSYQDVLSVSIDFDSRGINSAILIFGACHCDATNLSARVSFRLAINTDGGGAVAYVLPESITAIHDQRDGSNQENFNINLQGFDPGVLDDEHVITMQAKITDGFGAVDVLQRQLFVVDLGPN